MHFTQTIFTFDLILWIWCFAHRLGQPAVACRWCALVAPAAIGVRRKMLHVAGAHAQIGKAGHSLANCYVVQHASLVAHMQITTVTTTASLLSCCMWHDVKLLEIACGRQ